ncbi:hypothetical protein A2999_00470 [Candidatus Wolfebacteria bacterium RIFCSPLOWO2_01_FULL_38_11]|uniref:TVP38/TMEM64 family membrane protein n=2 Tax=Candidatus Wolfeibacteriota TaxID=1752735 RepID=A0A0G0IG20_9BACT|nr:MAG: hypothetical protein US36_C0004G0025 [Candidatus Wolfebacteria bacterium GW2011_GWC1_37_10]OGM91769.1 MAG: hypothetical protein A2999_00470 [Candidatus Wolfebacteria bacterium RIFCSPLOWO2_01_FULL_38_11]
MYKLKKYLLLFFLVILIAFVFWGSISLQNAFYNTIDFFKGYLGENKILGLAIFAGLAAVSAIFSPFSSIPLVPIAIVIWGTVTTFAILGIGWFIGDIIAYFIGSYAGHSIIEKLFFFKEINDYVKKIPRKAEFWLVLFFRLAMPSEIGGYVLGVIHYHFGKYLLATFLAEMPFALIAVYAGEAFLKKEPVFFLALIIVVAILVATAFYATHKRQISQN